MRFLDSRERRDDYNDDDYGREFSAFSTWDMIRVRRQLVPWHELIWFKQGIPQFAFITWLAVKDRLSTGVKMRAWGQIQGCLFCGEQEKTRDHLFICVPLYLYSLVTSIRHATAARSISGLDECSDIFDRLPWLVNCYTLGTVIPNFNI